MSKTIKILHICDHNVNEEELVTKEVHLVKQNRGFLDTKTSYEANILSRKCVLTKTTPSEKIKLNKLYGDTDIIYSISGTTLNNPKIVSVGEKIVVDDLNIENSVVSNESKIVVKSTDVSSGVLGITNEVMEIPVGLIDNQFGIAPLNSLDLSIGCYKIADYIDLNTMYLYRNITKKTLTGAESEGWFYHTTSSFSGDGYTRFYLEVNNAKPASDDVLVNCINNKMSIYKNMSRSEMFNMNSAGIAMNTVDGGILISVKNSDYTSDASADTESESISKFRLYLQNNNITIYYQLKEPIAVNIKELYLKNTLSQSSNATIVFSDIYMPPIIEATYIKEKDITVVDNNDYDIIDVGIVDYINEVKQGDVLYAANTDYELFTHNKIRWTGRHKPSVGTVYTVNYNEYTNRPNQYLIDNCPKCDGNGWYIDVIENNSFADISGIDKMLQDYMKILLSKKSNNIGTDLVTIPGKEFYGTNEIETRILTAIKEAEAQYKLIQAELLSSGTPLPNTEKLYRININNIEYDEVTLKAIVSITLYNYESQQMELNLEI